MNAHRPLSRRKFLQVTGTLAATAPLFLPGRLRAGEAAPSARCNLGFIGLGKQGRYLLNDFLKRPGTQVVAVAEVDRTRRKDAQRIANEYYAKQTGRDGYRGCHGFVDYRELLARADIDAVVIATPDHWHALNAIDAARAGKDIYCEKPLCQSIREARRIVEAVGRHRRVFQTGSMQRSSREFRIAVDLIRNRVIGPIERVEVAVGGPGMPCDLPAEPDEPGLDWDLWLGPAPQRPYNSILSPRGVHDHYPAWRNYREYGGGGVTDWGTHHFDIVQWALDMDRSGPVEILPSAEPNAKSGVRLRYANGVEVQHLPGNGITFYGASGKLYVNRGKFELWIGSTKEADSTAALNAIEAEYLSGDRVKRVYASSDHKADWLNCLRTRRDPITNAETGARSVTVCHLVNLAYYHGERLLWNPRTERFRRGAGRSEWLDVPYRDPWRQPT